MRCNGDQALTADGSELRELVLRLIVCKDDQAQTADGSEVSELRRRSIVSNADHSHAAEGSDDSAWSERSIACMRTRNNPRTKFMTVLEVYAAPPNTTKAKKGGFEMQGGKAVRDLHDPAADFRVSIFFS